MKLVKTKGSKLSSKSISEIDLIRFLGSNRWEQEPTKSPYELIRLRDSKTEQLRIVYQDNKKLRTKNAWAERRVFSVLLLGDYGISSIAANVKMEYKGVETEIDGITSDNTMIEIKYTRIDKETVEFYVQKAVTLGFDNLILVAKTFNEDMNNFSNPIVDLYQFRPDNQTLKKYYQSHFLPEKYAGLLSRRHVRYLLDNGNWTAQNRRYTNTAKWKSLEKFQDDISKIFHYSQPIKIYWSLSEMLGPLDEFRGNGTPIHRYLTAVDIDGEHDGYHRFTTSSPNICDECMKDAIANLEKVEKTLMDHEEDYIVLHSGSKGFHVYILDQDRIRISSQEEMESLTHQLSPHVDTFLSKTTGEFDSHRIFKVPYTVDATSGIVVGRNNISLKFEDELLPFP